MESYRNVKTGYYNDWNRVDTIELTPGETSEELQRFWSQEDAYFFSDTPPQPPTRCDLTIPLDNQARQNATLQLLTYTHTKGDYIRHDVAELLEANFDLLEIEKEYHVRGLVFRVLRKTTNQVEVSVLLHSNKLTATLVWAISGSRLRFLEGSEPKDVYTENDLFG
mmetsp:Transcript_29534/g.41554  ORF Transcript_29534/g.41554 Transcript_29534/m.41554 type:complete len:166 (+) Transcript_29534:275-772(+)